MTQQEMDEYIHRDVQAVRDRSTVEYLEQMERFAAQIEAYLRHLRSDLRVLASDVRRV